MWIINFRLFWADCYEKRGIRRTFKKIFINSNYTIFDNDLNFILFQIKIMLYLSV